MILDLATSFNTNHEIAFLLKAVPNLETLFTHPYDTPLDGTIKCIHSLLLHDYILLCHVHVM